MPEHNLPDRTFHVEHRYGYYAIDEYRGEEKIREVLLNIQSKGLAEAIAKNLTRAYIDGLWDQWEKFRPPTARGEVPNGY